MKRLRYCVICEKELEPGGRVDRKYCGVGCTQAAYRLRHPEKQRPSAGSSRAEATADRGGHRSAGRLADSVARLEDQNENLRRELATLKARIAQMERSEPASPTVLVGVAAREDGAVSATTVDSRQLARERARADQAESSVVDLRAELAKAHEAVRSRQTDLDDKERQIERLETELGTSKDALTATRTELDRLRTREKSARQSGTGGARGQVATEPSGSQHRGQAREESAPYVGIQLVAMPEEPPIERVTGTTTQPPPPSGIRAPFPWEIPDPKNPNRWIPYWQTSEDKISWLEKEGRKALGSVPTQIYNHGERTRAREMRDWIESSPAFVSELAEELAGRIVCTRRSERRSRQQKDQLATLAFRDSVAYLKKLNPQEAARFDQAYRAQADMYDGMAREFVDAVESLYFPDR